MIKTAIIKRLPSGEYRLYSRKKDKSGKRRNLGTYDSLKKAKERETQVQFFKSHADDGEADDGQTKTLSRLSNIASYLEEAGFIDSADKVYATMSAIDGDLENDLIDSYINTDEQMNTGGGIGFTNMSPGHGGPSMSMDIAIAQKLINIANKLDKIGAVDDADKIDLLVKTAISASGIIRSIKERDIEKIKQEMTKFVSSLPPGSNPANELGLTFDQFRDLIENIGKGDMVAAGSILGIDMTLKTKELDTSTHSPFSGQPWESGPVEKEDKESDAGEFSGLGHSDFWK